MDGNPVSLTDRSGLNTVSTQTKGEPKKVERKVEENDGKYRIIGYGGAKRKLTPPAQTKEKVVKADNFFKSVNVFSDGEKDDEKKKRKSVDKGGKERKRKGKQLRDKNDKNSDETGFKDQKKKRKYIYMPREITWTFGTRWKKVRDKHYMGRNGNFPEVTYTAGSATGEDYAKEYKLKFILDQPGSVFRRSINSPNLLLPPGYVVNSSGQLVTVASPPTISSPANPGGQLIQGYKSSTTPQGTGLGRDQIRFDLDQGVGATLVVKEKVYIRIRFLLPSWKRI